MTTFQEAYPKNTIVRGRKGTAFANVQGRTTGTFRRCQLEGCSGIRVGVRWPDGHITWPCSRGMKEDRGLRIR